MKNKSILNFICFLMGFGVVTSSCEDMLTPDLERYTETFAQDTLYSFLGIMRSVQDIAERQVILGEARGDLTSSTAYASDSIDRIANYEDVKDGDCSLLNIADYYKIINQCNYYIASADTSITKNGIHYMRREYAQVQAIRAWTYMQMVQLYGNVPFVTEPIANTQAGERAEEAFRKELMAGVDSSSVAVATASNLVTLLQKNGLDRALSYELTYGRPSYGNFNTGSSVSIPSGMLMFPMHLVYGDLYLMANRYDEAAKMYYTYLRDVNPGLYNTGCEYRFNTMNGGAVEYFSPDQGIWSSMFSTYTAGGERITYIAGAANKTFGRMLTAVANVYGYKTSSEALTTGGEETGNKDDSGKDEITDIETSGRIVVNADEKYRQLEPSQSYVDLSYGQKYCVYDLVSMSNTDGQAIITYPEKLGDSRIYFSAPHTRLGVDNDRYRIITKFTPSGRGNYNNNRDEYVVYGFANSYAYTMYRVTQIWLRYAEAINRMGFPQHAFAVLKDGLSGFTVPSVTDSIVDMVPTDILLRQDTLQDVNGEDSIVDVFKLDTIRSAKYSQYVMNDLNTCGAYYITADELQRTANYPNTIDFTRPEFNPTSMRQLGNSTNGHYTVRAITTAGVHSLGSGSCEGIRDTLYTYDRCVAGKIATRKGLSGAAKDAYVQKILAEGIPFNGSPDYTITYNAIDSALAHGVGDFTKEDVIDAVEDLIVDEMALELAFEGFRFGDLVRVAGHRVDGVNWFANKIANRNGSFNAALQARLQDRNNWFLPLPR